MTASGTLVLQQRSPSDHGYEATVDRCNDSVPGTIVEAHAAYLGEDLCQQWLHAEPIACDDEDQGYTCDGLHDGGEQERSPVAHPPYRIAKGKSILEDVLHP